MAVTLRSEKELEKPKNNSNEDEQSKKGKGEAKIEENLEAKTKKGGVEVNNRGDKQKSDQVSREE